MSNQIIYKSVKELSNVELIKERRKLTREITFIEEHYIYEKKLMKEDHPIVYQDDLLRLVGVIKEIELRIKHDCWIF